MAQNDDPVAQQIQPPVKAYQAWGSAVLQFEEQAL
jgi:hypothetical protein